MRMRTGPPVPIPVPVPVPVPVPAPVPMVPVYHSVAHRSVMPPLHTDYVLPPVDGHVQAPRQARLRAAHHLRSHTAYREPGDTVPSVYHRDGWGLDGKRAIANPKTEEKFWSWNPCVRRFTVSSVCERETEREREREREQSAVKKSTTKCHNYHYGTFPGGGEGKFSCDTAGGGKFSRDRRRGKVFELSPPWGGKVFAAGESFRAEAPLGRESIRGGGKFST